MMSILVQTDVLCDTCDSNWIYGGPAANVATPRIARQYARGDGWIRRFNKEEGRWEDVCPRCLDRLDNG